MISDARPDLLQVFRHRKGKDYHELFAAVAKETSPKLFMALAARFGWHSGTLDRCLFLNVLIKISISSCLTKKHGMCTIYGLKQCGREWLLQLTSFLKIWFKLLCVDHSVFYNGHLSLLMGRCGLGSRDLCTWNGKIPSISSHWHI